jgi:hypothetical protein
MVRSAVLAPRTSAVAYFGSGSGLKFEVSVWLKNYNKNP